MGRAYAPTQPQCTLSPGFPRISEKFGLPLEPFLGHVINAVLTTGKGIADDHQPGPLQLAVGFPICVNVNVAVTLDIKAKSGIDLPKPMWSSYRAQQKARDSKGVPKAKPGRKPKVISYDRVAKSFVDASGPLEAGGTFSGSGCITSKREFSAAGDGSMNDDLDTIRRVLAADVESFRRLVERYQRPLLTLICNLTPPDIDHEESARRCSWTRSDPWHRSTQSGRHSRPGCSPSPATAAATNSASQGSFGRTLTTDGEYFQSLDALPCRKCGCPRLEVLFS